MLLYWQSLTFFPALALAANDFGSTFGKEPLNYYYDL
jgi:hypothetical protein